MGTKRIEYFDLMKGIVIILVVWCHCNDTFQTEHNFTKIGEMLEHLRMPMYFFLSGVFFKEYSGLNEFALKKVNKLLLPCAFFAILRIIPDAIIGHVTFNIDSIRHFITWSIKTVGGYWFLASLFIVNVLYYVIKIISKKFPKKYSMYVEIISVVACAIVGYVLSLKLNMQMTDDLTLLFNFVTSLMAMPFFCIAKHGANLISKIGTIQLKYQMLIALGLLLCWGVTAQGGVYLVKAFVENNIVLFYCSAMSGIIFVYICCLNIKKIPVINYFGRYSLVIYTTHILFIKVLEQYLSSPLIMFAMIIAIMPCVIWFFVNYFPHFTAQKELLVLKNRRVVLNIKK